MFRTSRMNTVVVPLIALVAVLTLACHEVEATVKPFKVKGGGNAPEGLSVVGDVSPYTASGTATHLGRYSGFGVAQVTGMDEEPTDPDAISTGSFTGGFVFVAANGDRLVCEHPGTFGVYSDGQGGLFAVFDAIFSPTNLTIGDTTYESTGRFANVNGGFRMIAITDSFTIDMEAGATTAFDFEWRGKGWFNFPSR
jgi:hypothetical protein